MRIYPGSYPGTERVAEWTKRGMWAFAGGQELYAESQVTVLSERLESPSEITKRETAREEMFKP